MVVSSTIANTKGLVGSKSTNTLRDIPVGNVGNRTWPTQQRMFHLSTTTRYTSLPKPVGNRGSFCSRTATHDGSPFLYFLGLLQPDIVCYHAQRLLGCRYMKVYGLRAYHFVSCNVQTFRQGSRSALPPRYYTASAGYLGSTLAHLTTRMAITHKQQASTYHKEHWAFSGGVPSAQGSSG
jgi:hypothetical protein